MWSKQPKDKLKTWVWLGGLLLYTAVVLFYRLESLPRGLHGDEGATGKQALYLLSDTTQPLMVTGWAEHPLVSFIPFVASIKLVGWSVAGLRTGSVWTGLLTAAAAFGLWRQYFGRRGALMGVWLLVTSHWFIAAARLGTAYIQVMLVGVLVGFWALQANSRGRGWHWALLGVSTALGFYTYFAGRLFAVVAGLFWLGVLVGQKNRKSKLRGLAVAGIFFGLTVAPMLPHYWQMPERFTLRSRDVSLVSHWPEAFSHYQTDSAAKVIGYQLYNTLKIFWQGGDNSEQYGFPGPMVPAVWGVGLLGGVLLGLRRWRDGRYWLMLAWLGLGIWLGGVVVLGPWPPFFPRLSNMIVPVVTVIGVFLVGLDRRMRAVGWPQRGVAVGITLVMTAGAFWQTRAYFGQMGSLGVWANYEPATEIGLTLQRQPELETLIMFDTSIHYATQGNIDYLAYPYQQKTGGMTEAAAAARCRCRRCLIVSLPYNIEKQREAWEYARDGQPRLALADSGWSARQRRWQAELPGGRETIYKRPDGALWYVTYETVAAAARCGNK